MLEAIRHDINLESIIAGAIMYGIIRGIWKIVLFLLLYFERRLQSEVGLLIDHHVRTGHKSRFKHCREGACAIPGLGTVQDSIRPEALHQS